MSATPHAMRANGPRYWLHLNWNTARYYAAERRWAALYRALWLTLIRGYYLEVCQDCGRKVSVVWHADDEFYADVTRAGHAGVFCIPCFDRRSDAVTGSYLVWVPVVASPSDGTWESILSRPEMPRFWFSIAHLGNRIGWAVRCMEGEVDVYGRHLYPIPSLSGAAGGWSREEAISRGHEFVADREAQEATVEVFK